MAEELEGVLPDELDAWLSSMADETGRGREELLARAVAAYRLLEENELPADRVEELEERLDAVDESVADLEGELDESIADVRQRVVQVMRTAESKADEDHDHPGQRARIDAMESRVEELETDLQELADRVDAGFENYETILEHLTEETDALDGKATDLARAVIALRKRTAQLESANAERTALNDLRAEANRRGIESAKCEGCDSPVQLGLLGEPRCPHCDAVFENVEPAKGFLGSARLLVGDRPALTGETDEVDEPADIFGEDDG